MRNPPGCYVKSGLAVTVLQVDLELGSGEEILIDPGLAVPEHRDHHSLLSLSLYETDWLVLAGSL